VGASEGYLGAWSLGNMGNADVERQELEVVHARRRGDVVTPRGIQYRTAQVIGPSSHRTTRSVLPTRRAVAGVPPPSDTWRLVQNADDASRRSALLLAEASSKASRSSSSCDGTPRSSSQEANASPSRPTGSPAPPCASRTTRSGPRLTSWRCSSGPNELAARQHVLLALDGQRQGAPEHELDLLLVRVAVDKPALRGGCPSADPGWGGRGRRHGEKNPLARWGCLCLESNARDSRWGFRHRRSPEWS
jgi:hypothetical protein